MQGCLSTTKKQMGAVAFVSPYPTRQLSCGTRAAVTRPGLVCGRLGTAHKAQLLAWLPQRGLLMWFLSGVDGNCLSWQSFVPEPSGTATVFCFLLGRLEG